MSGARATSMVDDARVAMLGTLWSMALVHGLLGLSAEAQDPRSLCIAAPISNSHARLVNRTTRGDFYTDDLRSMRLSMDRSNARRSC